MSCPSVLTSNLPETSEHDLDDLLQMLPPRNCFEWELNTPLTTQPQRVCAEFLVELSTPS